MHSRVVANPGAATILLITMLQPTHIAETALYVDDLERAIGFYTALFGCVILRRDERFCALRINDAQVLLLFRRGGSSRPTVLAGGTVPAHDGAGPLHVCFGIAAGELGAWEQQLQARGLAIESRVRWNGGAVSLYFHDPDGHAVELATPGVWSQNENGNVSS
jgi:catechol 2,3-dioxygenase-like lactoylglutathione lyase family enzyme